MRSEFDENNFILKIISNNEKTILSTKAYETPYQMGLIDFFIYLFCGFEKIAFDEKKSILIRRTVLNEDFKKFGKEADFRSKAISIVLSDIEDSDHEKRKTHLEHCLAYPASLDFTIANDIRFLELLLEKENRHVIFNHIKVNTEKFNFDEIAEKVNEHPKLAIYFTSFMTKLDQRKQQELFDELITKIPPHFANIDDSHVFLLNFLKEFLENNPQFLGKIDNKLILFYLLTESDNVQLDHLDSKYIDYDIVDSFLSKRPELIDKIDENWLLKLNDDQIGKLIKKYPKIIKIINKDWDKVLHHLKIIKEGKLYINEDLFQYVNTEILQNKRFQLKLACNYENGLKLSNDVESIVIGLWGCIALEKWKEVRTEIRRSQAFYDACHYKESNHPVLEKMFDEIVNQDVVLAMVNRNVSLFNRLNPTLIEDASFQEAVKSSSKIQDQLTIALSNRTISSTIIKRNFLKIDESSL